MTQLSQLSEAEIEERFQIIGNRPIQFLLSGLAERREPFNVSFNHGSENFLTMLLAAPSESNKLLFDCSGSVEINRKLLQSDHLTFHGRPDGIQVQFKTGIPSETLYAGARAFSVALPQSVLRLQRREAFRIVTPLLRPLPFYARLADNRLLNVPIHDISCAGLGLTTSTLPEGVEPGLALKSSRFQLPEDSKEIFPEAIIRHITESEGKGGQLQWRIGVELIDLPYADENRIQRYIARVEHERRELS